MARQVTDQAALQLLVPGAEVLLDAVRGLPGAQLLEPAHVSLGYPWRRAAEADTEQARETVRRAAAGVPPFTVRFPVAGTFAPDPRGRVLVHVAPQDEAPFRALAELVRADLREVHLSVARVLAGGDVGAVLCAVAPLLPLQARVEVLELTVQRGGVWEQRLRVPLGG